jgi:hypothetical protein
MSSPTAAPSRCQVNKQTLPAKMAYFFWLFSNGGMEPYLPVAFEAMGLSSSLCLFSFFSVSSSSSSHFDLTDSQIGILGVIVPLVSFFAAPLWGSAADRTASHQTILFLTFSFAALIQFVSFLYDCSFQTL